MGQTLLRFPAQPLPAGSAPTCAGPGAAASDAIGSSSPLSGVTEPVQTDDRPPYQRAARYGQKRLSAKALLAVLTIHAGLALALLQMGIAATRERPPERLTVFDVKTRTPPPPAPPLPEPQQIVAPETPPSAQLTAPTAMIALLNQRPVAPVKIEPRPAPVVQVEAPPAPSKQPGPPASITPPDFSAAQLNNPGPDYPFQSRRDHEQGVALLRVLVTPDGRAGEVKLERSSGYSRLDRAALKTVRRWRFLPAKQAGAAVAAWVLVPVGFSLS